MSSWARGLSPGTGLPSVFALFCSRTPASWGGASTLRWTRSTGRTTVCTARWCGRARLGIWWGFPTCRSEFLWGVFGRGTTASTTRSTVPPGARSRQAHPRSRDRLQDRSPGGPLGALPGIHDWPLLARLVLDVDNDRERFAHFAAKLKGRIQKRAKRHGPTGW